MKYLKIMAKLQLQDSSKLNRMGKFIFLYIVLICSVSLDVKAQDSKFFVTEKTSDKYAYIDVIKTYERIAEKGYISVDLFKKLGNAYYLKTEFNKAAQWYCELFAICVDLEPEYYHQYAKCLLLIGQSDTANEILQKLKQKSAVKHE